MKPTQQPFTHKLSIAAANEMRRLRARGATLAVLARRFGVSRAAVHAVVRYRSYAPDGALVVVLSQDARALLATVARARGVPCAEAAALLLARAVAVAANGDE